MLVQPSNLIEVLDALLSEAVLALDTETSGLEYFDKPFSFSIAGASSEFDFDERVIPNLWEIPQIVSMFGDSTRTWIYQNAKFDAKMFRRKGIEIKGGWADIAVAARIVRNDYLGHKPYSLAAQAKRHGMEKSKAVDECIKSNNYFEVRKNFFGEQVLQPRFDYVPLDIMEKYASLDARITYDLYHIYIKQMDEKDLKLFEQEKKLTKVCFQMEEAGTLVDKAFTLQGLYGEKEKVEKLKLEFSQVTSDEFVNSAKSLQKHFQYQFPVTDEGNPSADDEALEFIIANSHDKDIELAKLVQRIRYHDQRISTYFTNYLNSMDNNCIIHATMWQAGTRTGRFSYSNPNLQNIPKDDDQDVVEDFPVRSCFIPRPGNIFVSMDYSQMEYRMMAAYANEEEVIKGVMNGEDFHQRIADLVGIPRKQAKTLNFAILYGAGNPKIAGMLGCSLLEAKRLKYKYFMALPRVEKLIEDIKSTGVSRGHVTNWMGRKLYADPKFCYALPNHLIQSGGADVVKKAMVDISDNINFSGPGMVIQIHDQLVFDMPEEDLKYIPKIKEIMESTFPDMNGMKLKVDVSWSAKSLAEKDMVKLREEDINGFTGLQTIQRNAPQISDAHGAVG